MFATVLSISVVAALILSLGLRPRVHVHLRDDRERYRGIGRGAMILTALVFSGLALSGFLPPLSGSALTGYPLLLHVSLGAALLVLLPALGLLRAVHYSSAPMIPVRHRIFFWTFLTGGLVCGLSILLGMMPLFSAPGLETLLTIHRWSGLVMTLALIGLTLNR